MAGFDVRDGQADVADRDLGLVRSIGHGRLRVHLGARIPPPAGAVSPSTTRLLAGGRIQPARAPRGPPSDQGEGEVAEASRAATRARNSSRVLVCGKGALGTGTPRNE